ncbi:acetylglutamate kinase [Ravibacter arvi]|uniref:Acetylglutamate kinase n=1 Tax=Ravibacter arvi TaxID=2051041 RepID=A0ABP8LVM4_9BACT
MKNNSLSVIKIGGNIIDNPEASKNFLEKFSDLPGAKILIHGGGKVATQTASRLGIETRMVEGRRITDRAMLEVVTMVYGGLVNKNIVATLQSLKTNAIGLTGADAGIIEAEKRPVKTIDYGYVGDVKSVNSAILTNFLENGLVPVIAPLTFSAAGDLLNTNADTMASAAAVALAGNFNVSLIYCFEKDGVLSDPDNDESVISALEPGLYATYKQSGVINKGMIPKLDNSFDALAKGVGRVVICHAKDLHAAVEGSKGTQIHL